MSNGMDLPQLVQRTNELLTILVKIQLTPVFERELSKEPNRKLYELTGQELGVKDISANVGLAKGTISALWNRWEQLGLLIKDRGRYRRTLG